jgi:hypothetical protein
MDSHHYPGVASAMTDEQFDEYISARQRALQFRRNEIKKLEMQTLLNLIEQYTSLCVDNKVEDHVKERFLSRMFEIAFS